MLEGVALYNKLNINLKKKRIYAIFAELYDSSVDKMRKYNKI